MELKELIGEHKLSGVEFGEVKDDYYSDSTVIHFILDGIVYSAVENPSDGYRSSLREIFINKNRNVVKNKFEPVEVLATMRKDSHYENNDVLDFYDIKTSKIVLSVGTKNYDDWYPSFVANFNPENMIINQK